MSLTEPQLRRLAQGVPDPRRGGGSPPRSRSELAAGRADEAVFTTLLLSFPVVGFFVLSRRPDNRLALADGRRWGSSQPSRAPAGRTAPTPSSAIFRTGPLALALAGPGWVPFIAISGFLLLLFPDGHLPSPRWRWFAWLCGVALAIVFVAIWFYPGDFADSGYPEVVNPIGVEALGPILDVFGVPVALGAAAGGGRRSSRWSCACDGPPTTSCATRSAGSRTPRR